MAFLLKCKKDDLITLVRELGETVPENARICDLKTIIVNCAEYEENVIKDMLTTIKEDRLQEELRQKTIDEREHELKIRELELRSINNRNGSGEISSRGSEPFHKYWNILQGVLLDPPNRSEEWPFFLNTRIQCLICTKYQRSTEEKLS